MLVLRTVAIAAAAEVQLQGRVPWLGGWTLVLTPDASGSITVDLSRVGQDEYSALTAGDRMVVTGTVTNARDRVVAASVQRVVP